MVFTILTKDLQDVPNNESKVERYQEAEDLFSYHL